MKRRTTTVAVAAVLALAALGPATTAGASPSKTKACSSCHRTASTVKVTLKKRSSTATRTTYSIAVTGGTGKAGWAVYSGTKNIRHSTSPTGTFTVTRGRSYKVRAVKKSSGCTVKTLTVK